MDDDDKQPRFQHAWFLGLIRGSDEVIALHPDGVQRHHGEWRVSPLDDPELNLRELKSSSGTDDGMRLEKLLDARRVKIHVITKVGILRNAEKRVLPANSPLTQCGRL